MATVRLTDKKFKDVKTLLAKGLETDEIVGILGLNKKTGNSIKMYNSKEEMKNADKGKVIESEISQEVNSSQEKEGKTEWQNDMQTLLYGISKEFGGYLYELLIIQKRILEVLIRIDKKEIPSQITVPYQMLDNDQERTGTQRIMSEKLAEITEKVTAIAEAWK